MEITGTNKIRGILDLNSIHLQIRKGSTYTISEDNFNDHNVQSAISMGFLTYKKTENNFVKTSKNNTIQLKNIYERTITLQNSSGEIKPGQIFTVTQDVLNQPQIRSAISKGMIEIVSPNGHGDLTESTIKGGEVFDDDFADVLDTVSDILDSNSDSQEDSNKDVSLLDHNYVIKDDKIRSVPTESIPDPKKKSVVWNPTEAPVMLNEMKNASVWDGSKKKGSKKESKKESKNTKSQDDEIKFVDKEIEEERVKSHPILKNKNTENNNEVEFI